MRPDVGASRLLRRYSSVLFPDPDRPVKDTNSPSEILSEISDKIFISLEPIRLKTFSAMIPTNFLYSPLRMISIGVNLPAARAGSILAITAVKNESIKAWIYIAGVK